MNRSISLIGLGITVASLATVAWAATSGWDETKQKSNQVTGKVNSIAVNENEVVIRITHDGSSETFNICSSYPGGDAINTTENERLNIIRQAFSHGDSIRVSYNGPFDRCLNFVEIFKDQKTIENAVATKSESKKQSHL